MKTLTVLEVLGDRSFVAGENANKRRDLCETHKEAIHIDQKSYRMGEAFAYNEAHKIMRAELHRLCNLMQNGSLCIKDFGIVL